MTLGLGLAAGATAASVAAVIISAIKENNRNTNGKYNGKYRSVDTCDAYRDGMDKQLKALNMGQNKLFDKLNVVETKVDRINGRS